jgi:hypothetical protein
MEDTFWHSRSWVKLIQASVHVWNKCREAHCCSEFWSCPLRCLFYHHRSRRVQLLCQLGEHLEHTGSETRTRARHLFLKAYLCSSNCGRRCECLLSQSQPLCSLGGRGSGRTTNNASAISTTSYEIAREVFISSVSNSAGVGTSASACDAKKHGVVQPLPKPNPVSSLNNPVACVRMFSNSLKDTMTTTPPRPLASANLPTFSGNKGQNTSRIVEPAILVLASGVFQWQKNTSVPAPLAILTAHDR